ncbi:hypothetical protein SOCEGT47_043200 [Sorangium cellulosum]|uniref:YcaO domain-containing protein n=1 Tax=Sorangium cellulosum TaxID=56 RepID=A0A4P2Q3A2_SORCE|nr:TOMM precursor leader peptide-binding protein [Sorangium cellulosum]AUX23790.1 hypothetical protein SOCEGT47_043200 [Sorangium cellulosum]
MRPSPLARVLELKRHLRAAVFDEERVFLVGEADQFMLRGALYRLVVPLVDGRRSIAAILDQLDGQASPPEILYALTMLEERGYAAEVSPSPSPEAGFWQALGLDAPRAAERLAATAVAVEAVGDEDPAPLAAALEAAGLRVERGAPVRVVATVDYLDDALDDHNRRALAERQRWLLVKPGGASPWLGPMFRPGAGPCWACLAARLRLNRPVEGFLRARGRALPAPPRLGARAGVRAGLDLAALALARWIAGGAQGAVDDRLLTLDPGRLEIVHHAVVRRPQCPACGDPGLVGRRARQPVALQSRPKQFTDDGGHRTLAPEETYARLAHHISPVTGVVASLGPAAGRDHPLRPVFAAAYRVCPTTDTPDFTDFHRQSAGKGRTAAQSRASALCEALERQSAAFQGDEARVRARLSDLGGAAVHPRDLLGFSEAQYAQREAWNARGDDPRRAVPLPFDERVALDWTPVWSLTHARLRYVPTAYCYVHTPTPPGERFCHHDPNGHAAGNCLEEAILQAFLELVERDAIAVWWYNRLRRPGVDLQSFDEPYFDALKRHYEGMGWALWALDLTHDLGIPTFAALARREDTGRFCVGFGCHLDASLGLSRALTELNQLFDPSCRSDPPWDARAIADPAYLLPDDGVPARARRDHPALAGDDLRDDVLGCVEAAARAGLETLVLDQTRPDIGLSAAQVIVPGLRHFWPRFGPGRLYDVPVRMGWLDRPLEEAQLNPVHLFL